MPMLIGSIISTAYKNLSDLPHKKPARMRDMTQFEIKSDRALIPIPDPRKQCSSSPKANLFAPTGSRYSHSRQAEATRSRSDSL